MPKYPAPDRSDFTPNQFLDDDLIPEGDLGSNSGTLADGRPYVFESWYSEGATFVTYFFSVEDLEEATPGELLALLRRELETAAVPEEFRRLAQTEMRPIFDASGNEMFSLTFVVGVPD